MPAWKRTNECTSEKNHKFCTLCADADCDTEPKTGWCISVCTISISLLTIVPCIFNSKILLHAEIILKIIGKISESYFFYNERDMVKEFKDILTQGLQVTTMIKGKRMCLF